MSKFELQPRKIAELLTNESPVSVGVFTDDHDNDKPLVGVMFFRPELTQIVEEFAKDILEKAKGLEG